MKRLQMYTDNDLVPSIASAIHQIEKLPLPYTGNKKKLLFSLYQALLEHDVKFKSILDAFSGSASVSLMFKMMGKRVIANDLLTSSYLNAVAFVENPGIKLSDEDKQWLLRNENPDKGTFVEDNYLGKQFRPEGKECRFNKFTLKECIHLDNFRANIDSLAGIYKQSVCLAANTAIILRLPFGNVDQSQDLMSHRKKQENEYGVDSGKHDRRIGIYYDSEMNLNFEKWFNKYVQDFVQGIRAKINVQEYTSKIKRASFLANLQQHILRDCMVQGRFHGGQSLAELEIRLAHQKNQLKGHWSNHGSTEMDFFTRAGTGAIDGKPGQGIKWWSFADLKMSGDCLATNMDATELLASGFCDVDCVYFDPPYGGSSSDYSQIYRFLEEYIYSAPLEELPHIQAHSKKFVGRKRYEEHFRDMLSVSRHIPTWLFSYNDNSWKSIDYITETIRDFKKQVTVVVLSDDYRYLYRSKQGRTNTSAEYLIIARD